MNITNNDYTKFYDSNGIVLIPLHTQYINNEKETAYLSKYSAMKQTNWNFISLLPNHTYQKLFNEAEYDGEYDPLLISGKEYNPNINYYKHKDNHNSIEAYTGKQLNLISIYIDYAFLFCRLFMELYKTSSLCTLTKNGFYFHYKYNDKLRTSRTLKDEYGFDIKNNTVIKIPPSYYNDASKNRFTYYFFKYNNPRDMSEYLIN